MTKPPCLKCNARSQLCHGSCEKYKTFKAGLEKAKAEERKDLLAEDYTIEQIQKRFRYNFLRIEKRNRKRF